MHDRYFYLVDVLLVFAASVRPRFWPAALLVQAGSLATYVSYLWGVDVSFSAAAGALAIGLVWLCAAQTGAAWPPPDRQGRTRVL